MPVVGHRNADAQEIGSTDHLSIFDRNFAGLWYDSVGGQNFLLGGGPFTLNLNNEKINSAPSDFIMSDDILTLAKAGLYLFSFQLMAIHNGGSSAAVNRVWLEQDPATGTFAELLPAVNYFPMAALASVSTGCVTTLVQVGINYRYRIRFQQSYGSTPLKTVSDGSALNVVRLFQNG